MDIEEIFISLPFVIKNNKGEDIKTQLKVSPRYITSYFEYSHIHDNDDVTTVTCIDTCGGGGELATPMPVSEFEKVIKPYLLYMALEMGQEIKYKKVPIRYKDFPMSELMGKDVFIDEVGVFNFLMMPYYHRVIRKYNDEEVDAVMFQVGQGVFYTLLSIEEFEAIVNL